MDRTPPQARDGGCADLSSTGSAHPGDERIVFCFRAPGCGRAVTWQDDAVWWAVFKRVMNIFEGDAIGLGCGAAADGSGEESVAGDQYWAWQSIDPIAECGDRMTSEVASADGDLADADRIAGFHRSRFPDALGVDRNAVLKEIANAAGVVAVGVGDEDSVGQAAEALIDFSQQVLGLISGVEKDQLVFIFKHPCVHMTSAEG